jgi:predicted DNA-binding WGR domain protein
MKRRFENKTPPHNKFWEVEMTSVEVNEGRTFFVLRRWGRIGTSGQTLTSEFNTKWEADNEVDRLLKQKVHNRGYDEVKT